LATLCTYSFTGRLVSLMDPPRFGTYFAVEPAKVLNVCIQYRV